MTNHNALPPGSRLGSHEIVAAIGAGGMGEVYRATDTRLKRDVAIKVLPAALTADRERRARFEREAQLLAALNHPNIAHVYGFEGATLPDGSTGYFLAMELVPGEDLAARLKRGALPLDEALAVARQVAEALEEAHEKGIVHRDLKPANVKVTPEGKVKVLDFGLAKAGAADASASAPELSQSPTLAHTFTQSGLILGTAAYMSPEQARGKPVDRRTDIWAFGVLLVEMLTGRRLFQGETVGDTLAAVLRQEIDWAALPPATPAPVRHLLRRCLERDPKLRLRDAREAAIELGRAEAWSEPPAAAPAAAARPSAAILAAVALGAGAAGWMLAGGWRPAPGLPPVVRLSYTLPPGPRLAQGPFVDVRSLALSPSGDSLAFVAGDRIYLRRLDSLEAVEVPGSGNGANPFFSPDGAWLGFSASGSLHKVAIGGGTPVQLSGPSGSASWGADGTILVGAGFSGLLRLPADGGPAQTLVAYEPGYTYGSPQALDGGAFLYTRLRPGDEARAETFLCARDGADCVRVLAGARDARYVRTGHLVYAAPAGLTALPLDLASRRTTGAPVVVETVGALNVYGNYVFDVSPSGTLVYASAASDTLATRLVVVSRDGAASPIPGEPRYFSDPKLSPEGRRAALHLQDGENDVWVADLARGTLLRLSTSAGEDETPVWSPDGRQVAWTGSRPEMPRAVFRRPADGGGTEEVIFKSDLHLHLNDWSPDGRTLLMQLQDPKSGPDLYTLDLAGGQATVFLKTRFREHSARLSPDGRRVVYVSDESGREEVYVQDFPEPGGKLRVSTDGGTQPLWSRDGRRIFFRDLRSVNEARFEPGPPASASAPLPLFADRFDRPQVGTHTGYDVFPDGRFLMAEATDPQAPAAGASTIVFVLNFVPNMAERLRAR